MKLSPLALWLSLLSPLAARPLEVISDRHCQVEWRVVESDGKWHSGNSLDGHRFTLEVPFEEVEVRGLDQRQWWLLWSDSQRVGSTRAVVQLQLKRSLRQERILPLLVVLGGIPIWWLAVKRWLQEARQRRQLQQTLAGYVGPEILQEMLSEPSQWLASLNQRRQVTVLFSDINDFSRYSEKESPEVVAEWLNEHYREMAHVIFAHHGTIIRFVGDQFMVLFGSPKHLEQPEEAAVRTALAMHRRLEHLKQLGAPGFYDIKIGIHCGSMLLAVIGDQLKRDYTAIGDEANLAARIQDLCKQVGCPTLVSQEIVDRVGLREDLQFEDRGSWAVKGREQEVRVYSISPGHPSR